MRRLARAKRGLNKIDNKSDIKTVEINGFGRVYRRPANDKHDQHEYVSVIYPNRFQIKCLKLLSIT
jgi:hypothetical protein